jgi:hypothetical protein
MLFIASKEVSVIDIALALHESKMLIHSPQVVEKKGS